MRSAGRRTGRGFTLIEMLVVVGIIITLIALMLVVGRAVGRSAREGSTASTMQAIDLILNDLIQTRGSIPAPVVPDPRDFDELLVVADATNLDGPVPATINSGGLLLLQARREGLVSDKIPGISGDLISLFSPYQIRDADSASVVPELPTPLDAWGRPIRYVHPQLDGLLQGGIPDQPDATGSAAGIDADDPLLLGDAPDGKSYAYTEIRRNGIVGVGLLLGDAPDGKSYAYTEIRRNGIVGVGGEALLDADGGQAPKQRPYLYSAGADGLVGRVIDGSGNVVEDFNADNVYLAAPDFSDPR